MNDMAAARIRQAQGSCRDKLASLGGASTLGQMRRLAAFGGKG